MQDLVYSAVNDTSTEEIRSFRGEHFFLSNMSVSRICVDLDFLVTWNPDVDPILLFDGISFPTIEHFYQAMKSTDPSDWTMISNILLPGDAKKLGRKLPMRHNWHAIKREIMLIGLGMKFAIPELRDKLLSTSDANIVEGNNWHDVYWGKCLCDKHQGEGENILGRMLMHVRSDIR